MKGTRISEKTFELIKRMLADGYSAKKIEQTLPDEIKVCRNIIYKVDKYGSYREYCGIAPEPVKEPKISMMPYAQSSEIIKAINGVQERLDSLCGMIGELIGLLK